MKGGGILILLLVASLAVIETSSEPQPEPGNPWNSFRNSVRNTYRRTRDFARGAALGSRDMHRAYRDMKQANWKNSDKYFHARGNRDAARHGAGGAWAARTISNAREFTDRLRGQSSADAAADQRANRLGRNGGNINIYRPRGLPSRY
ncbi:Serum amyloid A-2 protein [Armadillidium nasatum]|uniref:Serum amyloid A-2 protein n=1 Tax=Armadillidium nasatum TaxID=96803 RepID=A0A5N5SZ29_9CRUS|nr:Serum amyloid A-2 protein [Armadillidium nasatum]